MDPYTLIIEGIGIVIACVFTVIPAQEFAQIFRRLRDRPPRTLPEEQRGFDVVEQTGGAGDQRPEGRA
jgi:hypothetical protein